MRVLTEAEVLLALAKLARRWPPHLVLVQRGLDGLCLQRVDTGAKDEYGVEDVGTGEVLARINIPSNGCA